MKRSLLTLSLSLLPALAQAAYPPCDVAVFERDGQRARKVYEAKDLAALSADGLRALGMEIRFSLATLGELDARKGSNLTLHYAQATALCMIRLRDADDYALPPMPAAAEAASLQDLTAAVENVAQLRADLPARRAVMREVVESLYEPAGGRCSVEDCPEERNYDQGGTIPGSRR